MGLPTTGCTPSGAAAGPIPAPRESVLCLEIAPDAAARARREAVQQLGRAASEEVRWRCVLLVSELVGNVVRHARKASGIELRVHRHYGRVHVSVSDDGEGEGGEVAARSASDTAECGRGLALVAALALRWGTTPLPRGTRVWFDLELR